LGIGFSEQWGAGELGDHWIDPWTTLPRDCKPAVRHWQEKDEPEDDANARGGGRFALLTGV